MKVKENTNNSLVVEVVPYNEEEQRKYYFVTEDDFSNNLECREDGEITESDNGTLRGFYTGDKWILVDGYDVCNIVSDYQEFRTEYDYYGTGYDRVLAACNSELVFLKSSRYTSGKTTANYKTLDEYADFVYEEELVDKEYNINDLDKVLIKLGCESISKIQDLNKMLDERCIEVNLTYLPYPLNIEIELISTDNKNQDNTTFKISNVYIS